MVNSFLFGNQSSSQSKYLVEFRAGKMQMEGSVVNPIKKKGLVYLHKSDDNLMHFCWKDRTSGTLEDDLIVFPDEAEFKKVPQCTTGRVFLLKFKNTNRLHFFWMQEPNGDKDDEICKKVNNFLNNQAASSRNSSGFNLTDLPESELQNLINNVSSSQLMQILSRVNGGSSNQMLANLLSHSGSLRSTRNSDTSGVTDLLSSKSSSKTSSKSSSSKNNNSSNQSHSTATPVSVSSTPAVADSAADKGNNPTAASAGIQLSDLQNIISGLAVNQNKKEVTVDLTSIVNSEALKTLLANQEFMNKVKELIPDTSETDSPSQQTSLAAQVTSTIESVQFKSALNTFNHALQSGLLGPLIQQLNLSEACVEAANKGDLEAFVKAMEESTAKESNKSCDKKNTASGDSDMALE